MRKMVIILVTLLIFLVGILVVINSKNTVEDDSPVSESNQESSSPINGIEEAKANREAISKETNPVATVVLTEGGQDYTFTFELFPDNAPQSVYNFISLANSDFYNGLSIHRLVKDFVMQGGDPEGTGAGGPGYSIKGEFPANGVETGLTHQVGALAWARSSQPDSAGSQFYVVLNDGVQNLDNDYGVFGYMIDGYENLEYFNNLATTSSVPDSPVTIKSVTVDTKGQEYPQPEKL
ncbi:peptidylprolyl isomerase [Mollicutes bacterium LVI A0039]|nr:peptidylprolyl isomerase [Mollicutes bacterium LVI A0039]